MGLPPSDPGGAGNKEPSKAQLLKRVKAHQLSSELGRLQWHWYCERYEEGRRDPRQRTQASLLRFFEQLASGEVPQRLELLEHDETLGLPRLPAQEEELPPVAEEDVEASRKRSTAESCGELLELMPPPWRPLYEAPARLSYAAQRYDFVTVVREMLECPPELPLRFIHEAKRDADFDPCPPLRKGMLLAGQQVKDQCAWRNKRDWMATDAYARFMDLYQRFLREEILPALGLAALGEPGLEAAVQTTPVLRVMMPSKNYATVQHTDAEYGHLPEEINFWLPLTPVWGSNSLVAESFPGRGDFDAFEGDVGHVFRWWGNRCSHYTDPNTTTSTRVSLDFRIIPRRFWNAAKVAGSLSDTPVLGKDRNRWHAGEMRVGSYYSLERSAVPP